MSQTPLYAPDVMYFRVDPGDHIDDEAGLLCDDRWGIWYTYDSGNVPSPKAPPLHQISHRPLNRMLSPVEKGTIPTITELVGNYPNPFNPETWIAYKLAEASEVTIRIYDAKGKAIRSISFGSKPAGTYVDKESAAYWDGTTEEGKRHRVAFISILSSLTKPFIPGIIAK